MKYLVYAKKPHDIGWVKQSKLFTEQELKELLKASTRNYIKNGYNYSRLVSGNDTTYIKYTSITGEDE